MKALAPILLILGTLYTFYMTTWYSWQSAYWTTLGKAETVCYCNVKSWTFVACLAVSLLCWVWYGITLWRKKGYGILTGVYAGVCGLLYVGGILWLNWC